MRHVLAVIFCLPFLLWGGTRLVKDILFEINAEGHLKRAADANTIELAKKEMDVVVKYLEANHMTDGYTSILYRTPDADVGFWYSNLSSALGELNGIEPHATQLEKTNVLMKLRETLIDHKESGVAVTVPEGISVFPNNVLFCLWAVFSAIIAVVGVIYVELLRDII